MIKKIVLLILISVLHLFISAEQSVSSQTKDIALMEFGETGHDFGKLKKGTSTEHSFVYSNTGNKPLVIESVARPCTCTKIKWNKRPLMPGEKDSITVIFNAKDLGVFFKDIVIKTNAEGKTATLTIKGRVE